jgi:hypothetical protein
MRFSKTTAALAGVTFAGLLAGCSSGSKLLPSQSGTLQGQAVSRAPMGAQANKPVGPFASQQLNEQFARRPQASLPRGIPILGNVVNCTPQAFLYASDNKTGNLDEFCEDGKPNALVMTVPAAAGWGLAVQPPQFGHGNSHQMAVGVTGGTISIYTNLPTIGGAPGSVLTLSGKGSGDNALGLCWDDLGGLYATNWPRDTIDYFNAATVAAGGGPNNTITTTTITEDFYLACDFAPDESGNSGYLMLSGYALGTPNMDSDVAWVKLPAGPDVVVLKLGNHKAISGFPGGLALDKNDHLLVNNEYGLLYDVGNKEPWNNKAKATCSWAFNPNDLTDIVFDETQKLEVWAADVTFVPPSAFVTYAQSENYPLRNLMSCVTPGQSGGPTPQIAGEQQYLSIAVYKNIGV